MGYGITDILQLDDNSDYDDFYRFMVDCFNKSKENSATDLEQYKYTKKVIISKDKNCFDDNLDFMLYSYARESREKLPYYYISTKNAELSLKFDKVNVFPGRMFSGKTMLAYNLLDKYVNMTGYYVAETIDPPIHDIIELLKCKNSIIIFDSIDYDRMKIIGENFNPENKNYVCIFINSYSEAYNLLSMNEDIFYQVNDKLLNGKWVHDDIIKINKKLDEAGIPKLNENQNLLDNAFRIGSEYNKDILNGKEVTTVEEIEILIWLLVKRKIYYEEIVRLILENKYSDIVKKYEPYMQLEICSKNEKRHSHKKIICNSMPALLKILNSFVYDSGSAAALATRDERHKKVYEAIFNIINSADSNSDRDIRTFMMFDTLNEIFSPKYSSYMRKGDGKSSGAASLIKGIYDYSKIKDKRASDPNYWLQRAKAIEFSTREQYSNDIQKEQARKDLLEAVQWAKKAKQDAVTGAKYYSHTESDAIMIIAMIYGKLAHIYNYNNSEYNCEAINSYYDFLQDKSNSKAISSFFEKSRAKGDFDNLVKYIVDNYNNYSDMKKECDYLIKLFALQEEGRFGNE